MKSLSALEIAFLASEMAKIGNAKLQQVYQPSKKALDLVFHVRNAGRAVLKVRLPGAAYLVTEREPSEEAAITGFCSFLRQRLKGAILKAVSQPGFERVLILEFLAKNEPFSLVFELFSKGNIILAANGRIAAVEERQHWSTRELAVGEQYKLPPAIADPRALDEKQLLQLLQKTNKTDVVRFLALELSLGGLYAEEVCLNAGIDKFIAPSKMDAAGAKKVLRALQILLHSKPSPSVIFKDGAAVDAVPVSLSYYKGHEQKAMSSFSEALETYYASAPKESRYDREIARLNVIIAQQTETIAMAEKESREDMRRGELIYGHYLPIRQLLEAINQARKAGGWQAVRELQKKYRKITVVDEKNGKITVEL